MNDMKRAFVEALEESGRRLHDLVGDHTMPEPLDTEGQRRMKADRNWSTKWQLVFPKDLLLDRAKKLRRSDVKQGDWPLFRAVDAQEAIDSIEQMVGIAASRGAEGQFVEKVVQALSPFRNVVERHAAKTDDGWRFPEEAADVEPPIA